MADVTQILSQIEQGDSTAAEQLLPLVYEELRKLAAAKMTSESPGHTLQATALVHEAYLRLVDVEHGVNIRHSTCPSSLGNLRRLDRSGWVLFSLDESWRVSLGSFELRRGSMSRQVESCSP
jgi:hypothetical protein